MKCVRRLPPGSPGHARGAQGSSRGSRRKAGPTHEPGLVPDPSYFPMTLPNSTHSLPSKRASWPDSTRK
jgi:hypothetical protein